MAKVRIRTEDQLPWLTSGLRADREGAQMIMEDGGTASAYKIREPGTDTEPQLVEIRFHAHEEIELHSHDEPEIIYILKGSMEINNRTLEPGTSIFIDGGVFYQFRAGPEGLHFLNFRSHIDNSFHLPGKRQIIDPSADG
jgi:quercetin dioxygenase-like cupin family protein